MFCNCFKMLKQFHLIHFLPILYGVTDEFMDTFGLTTLEELPDLADIVEVDEQEDIFR